MSPADLFITAVYQPFFNLLVGIYWVMGFFTEGPPDMGIGVIFLTIVIRLLLLPMSLAGHQTEAGRREIAARIHELEIRYGGDRQGFKKARKKVFQKSRHVLAGELISLFIQIMIALMLWRVFAYGLEGEDFHLIYSFMPKIPTPFNLLFLGKYDLSHANLTLNLIQSLCIFIFETISVLTSPYPPTRGEVVRLQLTLPVVSFLVFMNLPAGKKLFVITTLIFSIILAVVRFIYQRFAAYQEKWEAKERVEEAVLLEGRPLTAEHPLVQVKE